MPRPVTLMTTLALLAGSSRLDAQTQAAKLTGTWEGAEPAEGQDKPVALVIVARGKDGFAGRLYFSGDDLGPVQEGRLRGDSLFCHLDRMQIEALLRPSGTMAVRVAVRGGAVHELLLTHTSGDTVSTPLAGRSVNGPAITDREMAPDSVFLAHRQPPSSASRTVGCLERGTLLLVGGGHTTDSTLARFRQLAGESEARIVVIPTASVNSKDPAVIQAMGERIKKVLRVSSVTILHTISRAEANSPAFVEPLRHATGVWIPGGEASWLEDAYLGTRTERELMALLDRGGVVGGSSAGALIWGSQAALYRAPAPGASPTQIQQPDNLVVGHPRERAFGLLCNVMVWPHFTEFGAAGSVERVLRSYPGLLILGIDEGTAIEVHANAFEVMGVGKVFVFDGRHPDAPPLTLGDGARYDIRKRAQPRS